MIILNLKTYTESAGENNTNLLRAITEVVKEYNVSDKVMTAPSMLELNSSNQSFPELIIIAQSVDNLQPGSTTGWTPAKNLVAAGIKYALYNHSEHRIWSDAIIDNIKAMQADGLNIIVCCENTVEALKLLEAQPYAIAFEPKELIGSGNSVSTYQMESVKEFIEIVTGKSLAFIGAGISTKKDISMGIQLGAQGFLLASAFVKASDPKAKLVELLEGGYI